MKNQAPMALKFPSSTRIGLILKEQETWWIKLMPIFIWRYMIIWISQNTYNNLSVPKFMRLITNNSIIWAVHFLTPFKQKFQMIPRKKISMKKMNQEMWWSLRILKYIQNAWRQNLMSQISISIITVWHRSNLRNSIALKELSEIQSPNYSVGKSR